MENFDEIFRAALKAATSKRGAKSKLVQDTGLTSPFIYRMLKGSQNGSEATRRKIADALGYSGPQYEEFLNIGRRELGLIPESETASSPVPDTASGDEDDWKGKYLNTLEEHTETLKILMDAQQRIAELEKEHAEIRQKMDNLKQAQKPIDRLGVLAGSGEKRLRKKAG